MPSICSGIPYEKTPTKSPRMRSRKIGRIAAGIYSFWWKARMQFRIVMESLILRGNGQVHRKFSERIKIMNMEP